MSKPKIAFLLGSSWTFFSNVLASSNIKHAKKFHSLGDSLLFDKVTVLNHYKNSCHKSIQPAVSKLRQGLLLLSHKIKLQQENQV